MSGLRTTYNCQSPSCPCVLDSVCPHKGYVGVLATQASEYDLIWREGRCRADEAIAEWGGHLIQHECPHGQAGDAQERWPRGDRAEDPSSASSRGGEGGAPQAGLRGAQPWGHLGFRPLLPRTATTRVCCLALPRLLCSGPRNHTPPGTPSSSQNSGTQLWPFPTWTLTCSLPTPLDRRLCEDRRRALNTPKPQSSAQGRADE